MNERKILLFILSLVIYCLYSVHMWFTKETSLPENDKIKIQEPVVEETIINESEQLPDNLTLEVKEDIKPKITPFFFKNACSILEIFTEKPIKLKKKLVTMNTGGSTDGIAVIGITIFLMILIINAALDVFKVKEEERQKRRLNPDGERRQSLAEFANKKPLRRESSKFGLHLFQIAESETNNEEEKKNKRQSKPYTRGDSTNSYLSDRKPQSEGSAPASIGETSEPKLLKRQSAAKLFGARPVPMVRRSSSPALPLNPDVQALMLGHRQASVDSDDESDGRGRRVRIIRRF